MNDKLPKFRALAFATVLATLIAAFVGCRSVEPPPQEPPAPIHVVVLHSNDVHGQVEPRRRVRDGVETVRGGLSRLAAYVNRVRRELRESEPDAELLVLDAGDWFQGTPEGMLDGGTAYVEALTALGHDVMAVGNHELDHGLDVFEAMLATTRPPAVCANVERVGGGLVEGARALVPIRLGALRVAVVGLLTPETRVITHPDARDRLVFRDPALALADLRGANSEAFDWWLPLTHMGVAGDRELARSHPDLPLVVGGHSHTFLPEGVYEGDVLIVQAGCKAEVCGRVDLWFDGTTHDVLERRSVLVPLEEEPLPSDRSAAVDERCEAMLARSAESMAEIVGELAAPLSRARRRDSSSAAGSLVADLTRSAVGADVGLMNRGGLRTDLAAGPVRLRDVFELLPFDNDVVALKLTGAELRELLRRSVEDGEHSGIELSGATLVVRRTGEECSLVDVEVAGAPLDLSREYVVAMNSFVARGGDGYVPNDVAGREDHAHDPRLLRELLAERFRREGVITPPLDDRYRVVP